MPRLDAIPQHLLDLPQPDAVREAVRTGALAVEVERDEAQEARAMELLRLRAELSLCAGRMAPTRESMEREVERAERVLVEVRALAREL